MSLELKNDINNELVLKLIRRPHISEKTTSIAVNHNQYTFEVKKDANKSGVKCAIEKLFNVKVDDVRIVNVKGKKKTFKQVKGRRNNWKKAYVKLQEGHKIDFVSIGHE